ncbi:MAG: hypothetical protein LBB61_05860 [Treponema sp.]|jgi:hypothetical protein|nr:hypothetical protein [Treponema sp.]
MDVSKIFDKSGTNQGTFIKTGEKIALNSTQKVALNRKGNILYNSGDIEGAKRIFLTTGYSDGLVRIGDYYKTKGKLLDALRMYWIAPDHNRADSIVVQLSELIKELIYEGDGK